MKRLIAAIICIASVFCLCACNVEKNNLDEGKISVVVTAFVHYDFVKQLAGDRADIKMLISPGGEVHTYEPTPSDILAISESDVFVYTGGQSDVWAKGVLETLKNDSTEVISFADFYDGQNHADGIQVHEGDGEHNHSNDEHFWTSPEFSIEISEHICLLLCKIDPDNSNEYRNNLDVFKASVLEVAQELETIKKERVRDTVVVGDRFPFSHLADFLGDEIEFLAAYPGCSSSTEPNAATIAKLADTVASQNLPCVFIIEFSNGKIAQNVASGTDAEILTLHSCHNVTSEDFQKGITYIDLMKSNAQNLRKALCE